MENPGFQEYMYPILAYLSNGKLRAKNEICEGQFHSQQPIIKSVLIVSDTWAYTLKNNYCFSVVYLCIRRWNS